jgi:hypothetical protein
MLSPFGCLSLWGLLVLLGASCVDSRGKLIPDATFEVRDATVDTLRSDDGGATRDATIAGQPATGWWAHCSPPQVSNCNADAPLCLFILGTEEGVCSLMGCTDSNQCGPAPGGTSVPSCVDAGVGHYCILDCSADPAGCPSGMVCGTIETGTTYHLCV